MTREERVRFGEKDMNRGKGMWEVQRERWRAVSRSKLLTDCWNRMGKW